jgi:polysaccharide biosynthesis transport protein
MTENNFESRGLILHPNRVARPATRLLYLEPVDTSSTESDNTSSMSEYSRIFRRGLPWIIATVCIGGFLGLFYSARQIPVYEAKVSLEIQTPSDNTASLRVGSLDPDGSTLTPESYLPTQIVILQSRTLQQHVRARLAKEKFSNGIPVTGRMAMLRRLFGGKAKLLSTNARASVSIEVKPTAGTRIVSILCDSIDPKMAAEYGNALANEYIDANLQAQWDAINHAREWLAQQLDETRKKLQASEDQLLTYGQASNLMFTNDKESVEQDKLKQIQEALSDAQNRRIESQSSYRIASSTAPNAVPQVLDNTRLSEYQAQLADLRRQLAELNAQYTPEHPKVKRIQAQIDQLETTFTKERDNVLARIRNEYQSALMRENLLASAYQQQARVVSDQTQKSINYNILQRDVETNRELYDTLLQKAREADIATALRGGNVRIIDPAVLPTSPVSPKFLSNILLGSFSGLMIGAAFVFVREHIDRSFKSPGESSHHLNLPELGVIPERNLLPQGGLARPSFLSKLSPVSQVKSESPNEDDEFSAWQDRTSPIMAESFRNAVTSVLHAGENGVPRVIIVTSAVRGEGKTTVVSNLGMALAETNRRVLLIDGDMRRPRLNELLNVPNDWGLSDLLREKSALGDCPLETLVRTTEMPELSVLTSGPAIKSVSSLLYSQRMLELIQRLRCEFDNILIDSPPMLDISDARVLGRLVDAAILVFRAGKTSRDAAMVVKQRLTEDGIPVLGTILNAWDTKQSGGYGYGYGYNYGSYEYTDSD